MLSVIHKGVDAALSQLNLPFVPYAITRSIRPEFGDFSTNVALLAAKHAKQSPLAVAQKLVEKLNHEAKLFTASATAPGFVNFTVHAELFSSLLTRWTNGTPELDDDFKKLKVNVELVSANPTGALHLGHARNGAVGDTLARAMKYLGYEVEREYYVNDGGNQIEMFVESVRLRCEQVLTGVPAIIPEGGYQSTDLLDIASQLMANKKAVPPVDEIRVFAVASMLDQIKKDLHEFGVEIDTWFSEASLYANEQVEIKQVLKRLKDAGKTYEHEGAVFLSTTPDGDDKDRVVVKSDGTYSYLMPDVAHHAIKYAKHCDLYVNIFGADHYSYITRLKSSIRSLGLDDSKLKVLTLQLVRMVKDGVEYKMSKRSGTAIGLRDLVEAIGIDAARWYMIDKSTDTHTEIDVDKALAKDASNPVYYVQYAHARCNQLLTNALPLLPAATFKDEGVVRSAAALLGQMAMFDRMVQDTVHSLEPHRIANYLYEVAKLFHAYYAANKIVDGSDEQGSAQRLAIVHALQRLLAAGLSLIGVSAPARM